MAWSWSHTAEAYDNARANLADLSRDELLEILGEWQYWEQEQALQNAENPTFELPEYWQHHPTDILVDAIWERAEDLATCDNGGTYLWVCPDGCHTVSVDRDEDDDDNGGGE